MSGRRHRDDDWDDDRRAQSDDRRDGWADDAQGGWPERSRGRAGGADRGNGDWGSPDRGPGDRGAADRGFGARGSGIGDRERGPADRGAGSGGFEDWYAGSGQRRGNGQGSNGQGGYRGQDYQGQGSGDPARGQSRQDRGGYRDPGYGDYRKQGRDFPDQGRDFRDGGSRPSFDGPGYDGARYDDGSNGVRPNGPGFTRDAAPEFSPAVSAPPAGGGSGGGRPYGRLSIFTLLDDKAAEFDQLAERAAEGVRALEPDTLVYVIHVVPKAPMQRIIYEIYRDRAALDAHERQPHIQQFVEDRKSSVLATNIIDLRLKYAKVAPLGGQPQSAGGQQASLPAAPQRSPRALESGSRGSGDGRYGSSGNGRYAGPGDGGYSDSGSGRRAAAGNGRYADGDGSRSGDQGNGNRRSQAGDRAQGEDWGQPQYPGRRYGGN